MDRDQVLNVPLLDSTKKTIDRTSQDRCKKRPQNYDLNSSQSTSFWSSDDENSHFDEHLGNTHDQEEIINGEYRNTEGLSFSPLLGLIFSSVSGGPYSLMPSLLAGGTFATIMGLLVFSLIWSLPQAAMVAELGTAYPDASGSTIWIKKAFGNRSAFICGYLTWMGIASDNAIMPGFFLNMCIDAFGYAKSPLMYTCFLRFILVFLITSLMTAVNFFGLETVGSANFVIGIMAILPFIILFFLGVKNLDPKRWFQMPDQDESYRNLFPELPSGPLPLFTIGGIMLRPFLGNMFYNSGGYDSVAPFTKEVKDLKKTFPRAMLHSTWINLLSYILPLLLLTGIRENVQADYRNTYFLKISEEVGGPIAASLCLVSIGLVSIAGFLSDMATASYLLMGMANRGYVPKILGKRTQKRKTPIYSVAVSFTIIICLGSLNFNQILSFVNFSSIGVLIMEYLSYLKLRYHDTHEDKPFRIPLPFWGLCLAVTPALFATILLILISSWISISFMVGNILVALLLFELSKSSWLRKHVEYLVLDDDN